MPTSNQKNPNTGGNPWRRLTLALILLVVLAAVFSVARDSSLLNSIPARDRQAIQWALVLLWVLTGVWTIRHLRRILTNITLRHNRSDVRVAMLVSRTFSAIGYAFVIVVGLHLLHIKVGSILVGGAVTGVIVGIGAQSTLSNLFAGLILFTLRPFSIGQTITIRTWMFSGIEYSGTVLDVNWYYTILQDGTQRRILPNSSIIISVITIAADNGMQVYSVPLPYSTSVHDFEDSLRKATKGQAHVSIREFQETYYVAQVKTPAGMDRDEVRAAIAEHRQASLQGASAASDS